MNIIIQQVLFSLLVTVLGLAKGENSIKSGFCATSTCRAFDEKFSYLWDGSTDMCEKPYDTVCSHDLLEPKSAHEWVDDTWDHYKEAEYSFHNRESRVLAGKSEDVPKLLKRAREFYASCINEYNLNDTSKNATYNNVSTAVTEIINKNPFGTFSLLHEQQESCNNIDPEGANWCFKKKDDWRYLDEYYIEKTGESAFHDFSRTVSDEKKQYVMRLRAPEFVIPKRILLTMTGNVNNGQCWYNEKDNSRKFYSEYIDDVIRSSYSNFTSRSHCNRTKDIDEIIDFEMQLANITLPENEPRFSTPMESSPKLDTWRFWYEYQMMYHELSFINPWQESPVLHLARSLHLGTNPFQIIWKELIVNLWKKIAEDPAPDRITDIKINDVLVDIPDKTYYLKLTVLLHTSRPEAIANYIHWRFLRNSVLRTKAGYDRFKELAKKLKFDHTLKKPREIKCVEENLVKEPVHRELMKEDKNKLNKIKKTIRDVYDGVAMSLIDRQIEQKFYLARSDEILEKHINEMSINIFGDETSRDDDNDVPSEDEMKNYYGEYMAQQKWRTKKVLDSMGRSSGDNAWPISSDRAGVFVTKTPGFYQLYIPGAILQKPFFDLQQDKVHNYAGIGAEIATTIWHSALFPVTLPQQSYDWVNYCFPLNKTYKVDSITYETEAKIYKSGKQSLDGVQMALDAYSQEHRYEPSRQMGYVLQNCEKQLFLAAYTATQCEYVSPNDPSKQWDHGVAGLKPSGDKIGLRNLAIYYPYKDYSMSNARINDIAYSNFYRDAFVCENNRRNSEYC